MWLALKRVGHRANVFNEYIQTTDDAGRASARVKLEPRKGIWSCSSGTVNPG